MTEEKKVATKRAPSPAVKAADLLEEAAAILQGITGKNATSMLYIAGRVDWCREKILELQL